MPRPALHESFTRPDLDPRWVWHCPPPRAVIVPDPADPRLEVEPDAPTDFWQRTHYGFRADNGHFLHTRVEGNFLLQARVAFQPRHQYDQAGLMVRFSEDCWIKASVEFEPDGPSRLGAVVTNLGYSDWSTQPFPAGPGSLLFRIHREGDDYRMESSPDGRSWEQLRVAHLHEARGKPVLAGVYACSPKGCGFRASFRDLRLEPSGHG